MQVLEMEEVESLVGNANRKRLGNITRKKAKNDSGIAICAARSDHLSKLVVVACVIMLGLLYISTKGGGGDVMVVDIESKSKDSLPGSSSSTFEDPTSLAKEDRPDNSVEEDSISSPSPNSAPLEPENIISKPSPTHAVVPVAVEENLKEQIGTNTEINIQKHVSKSDHVDEVDEKKGHNNNAYLYSKYATVLPLIDHPLPDEVEKAALDEKFGRWHFWDGDEEMRPMEDYCAKFPNRDIPGEDIPDDAWQADAVYVNHILNDADNLLARAMEAIFIEYGHGKPLEPEGMAERMKMFHWSREDLSLDSAQPPEKFQKRGDRGNGGWTTKRSFDGLVRRLLHAMMTQDTFTVVMGGHSAAQGQG